MDSTMQVFTVTGEAKEIAKSLLEIGSIQLNTTNLFTWVSGIKSPVYCDNRKVNSNVAVRRQVTKAYAELVNKMFPDAEVIAGVATGGISFGVLVAEALSKPFIYVRQEKKEHGMMKLVEGAYKEGQKVVVIEDHISTGISSFRAVQGLRESKLQVLGLLSLMTYRFDSADRLFTNEQVKYFSLCNLDAVLEVAIETKYIKPEDKDTILKFREAQGK
jgi:orotate phosphoribosyltransferase